MRRVDRPGELPPALSPRVALVRSLSAGAGQASGPARIEVVIDGWRFEAVVEPARRAALRDLARREHAAAGGSCGWSVPRCAAGSCGSGSEPAARSRRARASECSKPRRSRGHEDGERDLGHWGGYHRDRERRAGRSRRAGRRAGGDRMTREREQEKGAAGGEGSSAAAGLRGSASSDQGGSAAGRERWRATTRQRAVAEHPERRPSFVTSSGIPIADLYAPADVASLDEDGDLGRPGEFPFTRGVQPTMYRGRLWTMRQYAGFASAEQTNRRFRYLLEQGQTGLSVAFDLPTQMGYDSDAPAARRRGRPGRRPDQLPRGHGGAARRDPAGPREHVDDDQRHGPDPARLLRCGRRAPGRATQRDQRHDSERHPQGVHRARHVHLPAPPSHAPRHRRVRILRGRAAEMEHHLDQRVPHARGRGDGCPGARFHARRRHRVRRGGTAARARRRPLRAARLVLLRGLERTVRGGRQVPRRAPDVGADRARQVRGARPSAR